MITNELFMTICGAILTILVALITKVVIPWIVAKIGHEKMQQFDYYLNKAVKCANQVYTVEQWAEKKAFVTKYLTNIVNNKLDLSLSAADIDLLIEGAVKEAKEGL